MQSPDISAIPADLMVVGELRADPEILLLIGDDGLYYAYSLVSNAVELVEPDQHWLFTRQPPQTLSPVVVISA